MMIRIKHITVIDKQNTETTLESKPTNLLISEELIEAIRHEKSRAATDEHKREVDVLFTYTYQS